jgi:hypothetical protein
MPALLHPVAISPLILPLALTLRWMGVRDIEPLAFWVFISSETIFTSVRCWVPCLLEASFLLKHFLLQ